MEQLTKGKAEKISKKKIKPNKSNYTCIQKLKENTYNNNS